MLRYREIYVKLSIPSTSEADAHQQAKDIVKAQLSHLVADETRLPIKSEATRIMGGEFHYYPPEEPQ